MDNNKMSSHKAETKKKLSTLGAKLFRYVEFDDKEEFLTEIRKHPIGAVVIGATGSLIAFIITIAVTLIARNIDSFSLSGSGGNESAKALLLIGGLIMSLLALGATGISVFVYRSNVIYVTNQKIAEVAYLSLFNRKVTQLGLSHIENVTFHQDGILPHLFNYGNIVIETASELENTSFSYVPNPNFYSQQIIQAHEAYLDSHNE